MGVFTSAFLRDLPTVGHFFQQPPGGGLPDPKQCLYFLSCDGISFTDQCHDCVSVIVRLCGSACMSSCFCIGWSSASAIWMRLWGTDAP